MSHLTSTQNYEFSPSLSTYNNHLKGLYYTNNNGQKQYYYRPWYGNLTAQGLRCITSVRRQPQHLDGPEIVETIQKTWTEILLCDESNDPSPKDKILGNKIIKQLKALGIDCQPIPKTFVLTQQEKEEATQRRFEKNLARAQMQQKEEQQKEQKTKQPGHFTPPNNTFFLRVYDRFNSKEIDGISFGVASSQGTQESMKGSHVVKQIQLGTTGEQGLLAGVFDGHGGAKAGQFVAKYLTKLDTLPLQGLSHSQIEEGLQELFHDLQIKWLQQVASDRSRWINTLALRVGIWFKIISRNKNNNEWIRNTAIRIRHWLKNLAHDTSGTTATVALVIKNKAIFVANLGDSRTILRAKETTTQLSYDTKVANCSFKLHKRGGVVDGHSLLGGKNCAVVSTRDVAGEIGDAKFIHLLRRPTITCHPYPEEESSMVLACNGLYDVASSNNVGDASAQLTQQGVGPAGVAKALVNSSAHKNGFQDNVTVVVIKMAPTAVTK